MANATTPVIQINEGNVGIGTITPRSALDVTGTTGLTWNAATLDSSGLVTIGTRGTGGSLFINTPSINTDWSAGLGVDGSYSSNISTVNIKAFGPKLASGALQGSNLTFSTTYETTLSERMRIDRNGNVGIGTPSPVSTWLSGFDPSTGNGTFKLTSEGWIVTPYLTGLAGYYPGQGARPIVWADHSGTNLQCWDNSATDGISLRSSNGTTRLFVKEDGNVGIGTPGPSGKLHIKGAAANWNLFGEASDGSQLYGFYEDAGAGQLQLMDASGVAQINLQARAGQNNYINGGNVGIGTTTPQSKLHVVDGIVTSDKIILAGQADATDTYTGLLIGAYMGTASASYYNSAIRSISTKVGSGSQNPRLGFFTQNTNTYLVADMTEKMSILTSGNVGIGTDNPDYELQVGDGTATETINIKAVSTNPSRIFFSDNNDIGQGRIHYEHGGDYMNFWTDGAERMRISSAGAIKFNNYDSTNQTGTPTYLLGTDASGNIVKTNTVPGSAAGPYLPLVGGTISGTPGTLLISGLSNYTGLTVKGAGAARPAITWSNVNQGDLGIIYGTENNALVIGTGVSGLAALTLDTSQNATFAGDVNVGTGLAGTVNVGLTDAYKGVIEYLAAANTNLNIKNTYDASTAAINFQLRTSGTTVNALTLLGSGNATFAGTIDSGTITSTGIVKAATTFQATSGDMTFYVNNVGEAMRIQQNTGNVGIGTTTPTNQLQLGTETPVLALGSISSYGGSNGTKAMAVITSTLTPNGQSGGSLNFQTNYWDQSAYVPVTRMTILPNGNVGIGTVSPTTYSLSGTHTEIFGGSTYSFLHVNTTTVKSFLATNEASLLTALFTFSAHPLTFGTNNTEKMRITSAGNVGIGVTSTVTNSLLNVAGGINTTTGIIGNNTADSFTLNSKTQPHYGFNLDPIGAVPIGISGYFGIALATNSTEKMRITSAGGISFGSTGTAYGTSGQVLTSGGNASPTWTTPTTGTVTGTGTAGTVTKWSTGGTGIEDGPITFSGSDATFAGLIDAGGRLKVSGGATDQYYFEGARTGVGVTYRLYDNANNIYHDSWSSQVFRLNQNGGSGGNLIVTGGNILMGTTSGTRFLTVAPSTGACVAAFMSNSAKKC
jgi:hypothetical protein